MRDRKGLRNRKRNHASSSSISDWLPQESNMNRFHKNLHKEEEEEEEESIPYWLPQKSNMNRSHENLHEEGGSIPDWLPQESNANRSHKYLHEEEEESIRYSLSQKSNMNPSHENLHEEESGGGGLQEESSPTRDYESIPDIIDISDKEDDDDMDLQLALFNSCNVDKASEIIDLKKKGILSSTPLKPSQSFLKFFQAGESSVVECLICKEVKSSGEVLRTTHNCRHPFCHDCIKNYVGEQLQENIREIKCPEVKCQQVLEKSLWQQYVPDRLDWLMKQATIEGSVLQQPMRFLCPYDDCKKVNVDNEKGFLIRACPNCWKLFCAGCLVPWHKGMTCIEFKRERLLAQLSAAAALSLSSSQVIFIRR